MRFALTMNYKDSNCLILWGLETTRFFAVPFLLAALPLGGPPAPLPSGYATELMMPLSSSLQKEGAFNLGQGAGKEKKIQFPERFVRRVWREWSWPFYGRTLCHDDGSSTSGLLMKGPQRFRGPWN